MSTKPMLVLMLATLLVACGKDEPEPAAPTTSAPAPEQSEPTAAAPQAEAPAPAETPATPAASAEGGAAAATGEAIYKKTCALCHAAGVGGAPIPGNADAWKPRIEQGVDVLYKHAIEGFTGEKGMMPPRGANPKLSDEEVKSAVDYMVSKVE